MNNYYDRQGNRISLAQWCRMQDGDTRGVASDTIDQVWISTAWLGLDHGSDGPPLIFETMIVGGDHDEYRERYSTEADALAGHARIVACIKSGKSPEAAA